MVRRDHVVFVCQSAMLLR